MACTPDTARAMHQDALLLAIGANEKWKDAIGKQVWIGELKVLDRRPSQRLCPKMALIGSSEIVSIIGKLFCRKKADDLLDSVTLHKSEPFIEHFMRYVRERESRATRAKNSLLAVSRSAKAVLWVGRIFH